MKRSSIHWLFSIILLLSWKPVLALTPDLLADVQNTHTYGREITFSARVQQPEGIKDIFLFLNVEGENDPRGNLVVADSSGLLNFTYDVQRNPIHPFADISYWYTLNLQSGEVINSQEYYFQYTDNRFPWQTLKSGSVEVNWYSGEMEFGKNAFDILQQSILRISNLISISPNDPIHLYLYETQTDLNESLALGGQASIVPQLQVLLVAITPSSDQKAQMQQQIPHELTRLLLFQKTGITYALLPVWLREGISTQVEISPNPAFDFALANAVEKQTLISLSDICISFPQDTGSNLLASAQADSFTTYLFNKYGQSGMEKLIQAFTNGFDCEHGANTALGKNLTQLEYDWLQATFNKNALWQTITDFLPYLFILFLLLLIPLLNKPKTLRPIGSDKQNDEENE